MAAFFFWDGDRLQTDGSELEVPFASTSTLSMTESARSAQTDLSEPGASNVTSSTTKRDSVSLDTADARDKAEPKSSNVSTPGNQVTAETSREQKPRRPVFPVRFLIAGGLVAAAAGAGYWAIPTLRSRVEGWRAYPANSQLGLQVVRGADGQLSLNWNRTASALALARDGMLTVMDGPLKRELSMDKAQLRSGKLSYFPTGADVQFRLELALESGSTVTESVRVLLPQIEIQSQAPNQTRSSAPEAKSAAGPPSSTATQMAMSTKPVRRRPERPEATSTGNSSIRLDNLGLSAHPDATPKPSALLPPPVVTYDAGSGNMAGLDLLLTLLPKPPQWPSLGSSNDPALQTSYPRPTSTRSAAAPPAFVPPRPVKQVSPDPKQLAMPLNGKTEVRVRVQVARTGRVIEAYLDGNQGNGNAMLDNLAVTAAKQWVFKPATLHGEAVEATHRIIFEFRPPTR
ncbi:MAG: TonB family protein [Bryobacteraceae bacterium]